MINYEIVKTIPKKDKEIIMLDSLAQSNGTITDFADYSCFTYKKEKRYILLKKEQNNKIKIVIFRNNKLTIISKTIKISTDYVYKIRQNYIQLNKNLDLFINENKEKYTLSLFLDAITLKYADK